VIHAVAVAPALDSRLGGSVTVQPGYVGFDLAGADSRATIEAVERAVAVLTADGHAAVLLCSTRIRLALRALVERQLPTLTVLSYEEVLPSIPVSVHAQVEV
jgi:flagellar biosynthesis protein FlhA